MELKLISFLQINVVIILKYVIRYVEIYCMVVKKKITTH